MLFCSHLYITAGNSSAITQTYTQVSSSKYLLPAVLYSTCNFSALVPRRVKFKSIIWLRWYCTWHLLQHTVYQFKKCRASKFEDGRWVDWASFHLRSLSSLLPTGYFTQISTLADVQENVMEYLHVLSRPKVIDQEHDTVWTEAYIDSTVSVHIVDAEYSVKDLHSKQRTLIHNGFGFSVCSERQMNPVSITHAEGWKCVLSSYVSGCGCVDVCVSSRWNC